MASQMLGSWLRVVLVALLVGALLEAPQAAPLPAWARADGSSKKPKKPIRPDAFLRLVHHRQLRQSGVCGVDFTCTNAGESCCESSTVNACAPTGADCCSSTTYCDAGSYCCADGSGCCNTGLTCCPTKCCQFGCCGTVCCTASGTPAGDTGSGRGSSGSTSSSGSGGGSHVGAIVGGVVGGLVFIGLVTGAVWWFVAKKRRQRPGMMNQGSSAAMFDKTQGASAAYMMQGGGTGYTTHTTSGIPATYSTGPVYASPQQHLAYPTQVVVAPPGNEPCGAVPFGASYSGQPPPAGWMVPAGGLGPDQGGNYGQPQPTTTTNTMVTTTAPTGTTYTSGGSTAPPLQPCGAGAQPVPAVPVPPAAQQQPRALPVGTPHPIDTSARSSTLTSVHSDATRVLEGMRIAWSDITIQGLIGEGGFGKVYKGTWQGNRVAVKMLNPTRANANVLKELHAEVLIMSELRHPCMARVFGLVDEAPNHAIVMAYYKRGTLTKFMQTSAYHSLSLVAKLRLALQVASGMRFLHGKKPLPILHGDLKTSNLLLEEDGRVVLADFGLASTIAAAATGSHSGALTLSISPPEVLSDPHAPRKASADVYAFGVVLLEILTGKPPFGGLKASELRQVVGMGKRPPIPQLLPPQVISLINDCWSQDPAARPNFVAIMERLVAAIQEVEPDHDVLNTTVTGTYTSY